MIQRKESKILKTEKYEDWMDNMKIEWKWMTREHHRPTGQGHRKAQLFVNSK